MKSPILSKIKPVFFYLWFIAVVAGMMVFLLWAAYLIPVEKIKDNVRKYPITEIVLPSQVPFNFYGLPIDGFTDSLILNHTVFKGTQSIHTALLNPRIQYGKLWMQIESLLAALNENFQGNIRITTYSRFWHGALIFLKPLFYFFDLQQIRFLNLFLQVALLIAVLYLMYKRLGVKHCFAFLAAICVLNPMTTWQCLEYANVINVMLLAVLWVLCNKNPNDKYMFFIIGAVTILFDLLTFPLITLGIPLIIYILLYERSFKDSIVCVIRNSLLWVSGYALMLSSKWCLATLLTSENVLQNGWDNVLHRTYGKPENGMPESMLTVYNSISANLNVMQNKWSLVILGVFVLLLIMSYFFKPYKFYRNLKAIILSGIFFMPFVWYSVLVNHSLIHPHWTYKILAISVYAILSALVCCMKPKIKN